MREGDSPASVFVPQVQGRPCGASSGCLSLSEHAHAREGGGWGLLAACCWARERAPRNTGTEDLPLLQNQKGARWNAGILEYFGIFSGIFPRCVEIPPGIFPSKNGIRRLGIPAAWGVGNLHQTAAVEEEPWPSAGGSKSPGAVELVEEEAFDRFRRLVSVEAAVFNSELLCHRVGQFSDVI